MSTPYATSTTGNQLLDDLQYTISSARYAGASVLASLASTVAFCGIFFVLFLILRVRIKSLYASKSTVRSHTFEYPGSGLFDWVKPIYKARIYEDLLPNVGLDAVVFLKFVKMCRNMFVAIAIVGCCVCIPLSVKFNRESNLVESTDPFVVMTPTLLFGKKLIGHVVIGWIINIIVIINLALTFRDILRYRRAVYEDPAHRANVVSRTIMAYDIPKKLRSDSGLKSVAHKCNCLEMPYAVTVGTSVDHLESLIARHKHCIIKLESAILTRDRQASRGSVSASVLNKIRELESERIKFEDMIAKERVACRTNKYPLPYGFLTYRSQNEAHSIAQSVRSHGINGVSLRLAPVPGDIIWPNLARSKSARHARKFWINVLFVIFLVLWIIPMAAFGCFLTNLRQITVLWKGFAVVTEDSPIGYAILQGIVAPAITTIVFFLLPPLMRKMCKSEGNLTRTNREKEVIRKLFVLFFLINFFVFTCMGVIWDIVFQVIEIVRADEALTFTEVWRKLRVSERFSAAIIKVSSFWVMYLIHGCTGLFSDLVQSLSLTFRTCQRLFTAYTPRMRAQWYEPQPYYYANTYIWMVFYIAIALGLTVIQPLVLLVLAVYFTLALPLKKYELMYVCYTKNESYGLFWPVVHNIVIFSTAFGNLVLLCVVWSQSDYKIAMGIVPLPVLMIIYKIVSYCAYEKHYWYFTSSSSDEEENNFNSNELVQVYENPALGSKLEEPILRTNIGFDEKAVVDEQGFIREPEIGDIECTEQVASSKIYDTSDKSAPKITCSRVASSGTAPTLYEHPHGVVTMIESVETNQSDTFGGYVEEVCLESQPEIMPESPSHTNMGFHEVPQSPKGTELSTTQLENQDNEAFVSQVQYEEHSEYYEATMPTVSTEPNEDVSNQNNSEQEYNPFGGVRNQRYNPYGTY